MGSAELAASPAGWHTRLLEKPWLNNSIIYRRYVGEGTPFAQLT